MPSGTPDQASVVQASVAHLYVYFDFVSQQSYQLFHALPQALLGLSYAAHYVPMQPMQPMQPMPPMSVPPMANGIADGGLAEKALQLALASDVAGLPKRYVCAALLGWLWGDGVDRANYQTLPDFQVDWRNPEPQHSIAALMQMHHTQARAWGVVQTPSVVLGQQVFAGEDATLALAQLRAAMQG